ncbi:MAG: ATP-dependent RecD-like DNA helicase, partial [Acidimicrobiia bacterium]
FAQLVTLARTHEAKIVAVGDYRQLGAVQAGGLFRLIARTGPAVELDQVWRFAHPWERDASLRLRDADPAVIDVYAQHGRIRGGSREEILDGTYRDWAAARSRGESMLVTATDRHTVTEFNVLARQFLREHGQLAGEGRVTDTGVELAVGDEVLSLRNDRRLLTGSGGYVRNGDRWHIQHIDDDGSLHVVGLGGQGRALLPAGYAAGGMVDHAYATTVHKAQGVTVDRSVTIIDGATTAQSLYVGATRGRWDNQLAVICEPEHAEYGSIGPAPSPHDVIAAAMARDHLERTATELLHQQLDQPDAARQLAAQEQSAQQRTARHHADHDLAARHQTAPADIAEHGRIARDRLGRDMNAQPVPPPAAAEQSAVRVGELGGAQLRALWTEQAAINRTLQQTRDRKFGADISRSGDERKLADLERLRERHASRLGYLDRQLDEIAGRNPIARWRARDTTTNLTDQRTHCAEQLAVTDHNLGALQEQIRRREHSLGGRTQHDRAYQLAQARADTRDPQINQTLAQDRARRAERIATMPAVDQARYGIGPIPKAGAERGRWLDRAARIDQHHSGWDGRELGRDPAENRLRQSLEQSLERQIRPPQQQTRDRGIDRGIGWDHGISM